MKINLPDNVVEYRNDNQHMYCIPADGFMKMIGYEDQKRTWVHKDYRVQVKKVKNKKKSVS